MAEGVDIYCLLESVRCLIEGVDIARRWRAPCQEEEEEERDLIKDLKRHVRLAGALPAIVSMARLFPYHLGGGADPQQKSPITAKEPYHSKRALSLIGWR